MYQTIISGEGHNHILVKKDPYDCNLENVIVREMARARQQGEVQQSRRKTMVAYSRVVAGGIEREIKVKIILTRVHLIDVGRLKREQPKVTGQMVVWQYHCLAKGVREEECGRGRESIKLHSCSSLSVGDKLQDPQWMKVVQNLIYTVFFPKHTYV